jgi:hypothetical protein
MNRGSFFFLIEGGLRLKGEYSLLLGMLLICGHQARFYPSSLFSRASLMAMHDCRRGNMVSAEKIG